MASYSDHSQATQNKKWPRLRFRLSTLLVLITIISLFLGYNSYHFERQRKVVKRVLEVGGTARYDYERSDSGLPNEFSQRTPSQGPNWLRRLWLPSYVVMIDLSETSATDDDLAQLARLPKLENLSLSKTRVTSKGMVHLAKLKNLKVLALWNTQIDDEGLKHLAGLDKLWMLILDNTRITDIGLRHLAGLTNLEEWLGLSSTDVTDAGLEHLRGMVRLQSLTLGETKVTADGVRDLQKALPETDISYDR